MNKLIDGCYGIAFLKGEFNEPIPVLYNESTEHWEGGGEACHAESKIGKKTVKIGNILCELMTKDLKEFEIEESHTSSKINVCLLADNSLNISQKSNIVNIATQDTEEFFLLIRQMQLSFLVRKSRKIT